MSYRFVLNETSYHGVGAITEIVAETKGKGYKKAFVCSNPDLVKFKVTGKVLEVLEAEKMDYIQICSTLKRLKL